MKVHLGYASVIEKTHASIKKFVSWLERFGETSYDHQSYYAGPIGRRAKALYYKWPIVGVIAVGPMVVSEAFFPRGRRLFWKKQRFPIADAHYAMGFAYLFRLCGDRAHYERALHFLKILEATRCQGFDRYSWGYPFDWVTRNGTIKAGTPLITTTPYVYEAFAEIYEIDENPRWREIMRSIAEHAVEDIKDFPYGRDSFTCGYTPYDETGGVVNASAYRSFLLARASRDLGEGRYWEIAKRNLNFVLEAQNENGSWPYAVDGARDFIDHFHTCFVLKALGKIEVLTGDEACTKAIEHGVDFYLKNLFDEDGLPKPFARAPRLTVYRNELYDCAECINLGVLLKGRFPELDRSVDGVISKVLDHWQKPDGSFRSRRLIFGWDNVPMHRWGQSQMFRSLCYFLHEQKHQLSKQQYSNKHQ